MDDTQQTQPTVDPIMPSTDGVSSMNDVAGMTPPPAPVMPVATAEPAMPTAQMPAMPTDVMPAKSPMGDEATDADASYAEDVLNEILDSLDRIEVKLDAIEKKMG